MIGLHERTREEEPMPHVRESEPRPDDLDPHDDPEASRQHPEGKLGGHPFNPDETAPGEHAPDPGGSTGKDRHPDAVEGKPGSDL
jgi:hypothetical protein